MHLFSSNPRTVLFAIFLLLGLCLSAEASDPHSLVGRISVEGTYAEGFDGCSWASWSYVTYGRQRILYCDGVNVARAFQNLAFQNCSITINSTGYSTYAWNQCFFDVWRGQSPVDDSIVVRRHENAPNITNGEVDAIFDAMNDMLNHKNRAVDTACNYNAYRDGGVVEFSQGDGDIDSSSDFNSLPAGINVVRSINFCGGIGTNIIGCASLPGSRIAVVRVNQNIEHVLWAHEIGHNKGLQHRGDDNSVMQGIIRAQNDSINSSECDAFRQ